MKVKDIRELTPVELHNKLAEAHQELFNLRFQLAAKQLANYERMGQVKKTIARLNTIQRERELAADAEGK
jgi:large subunit ribosomal protein L29